MNRLRSTPRCRSLAWALVLFLLAPYLVWAPKAHAQNTAPNVYVLDFNNSTKVGGALLGRVAAAQMSLQLSESDNWFVVPDAQVQRRIQELNLKPPFDRPARVQIANGIDATGVIYGTIKEARVSTGSNPQAYVQLQVLVEDVQTGVLINGAVAEGTSTPRMGFNGDADVLLEEALGKAAFKAREFMDRFRLPEGTVLNTTVIGGAENQQLEALINIGARQGVRRGMEMTVTRQRQLVGRLKVTNVDSDISTARVTTNTQGVRPEDRVRAIFNFSDFQITRSRLRAAMPPPAGAKLASAGLPGEPGAAVDAAHPRVARTERTALFTQFRSPQDSNAQASSTTVQAPPKVVVDEPEVERANEPGSHKRLITTGAVRMLVGGLLVLGLLELGGRGGQNATRAVDIAAFGYQLQVGQPGARIKVTWQRPKSVRSTQVLQYIVWRADTFGGLQIVGAVDGDTIKTFLDSESTRTVNAFSGDPGTNNAGSKTALTNVPGIQPGQQYRYQIATAFSGGLSDPNNNGTGTGTGGTGGTGGGTQTQENFMSPLSQSTPWATAITPPIISNPIQGEQVQLDQLSVTWAQTPGADTYAVWVGTTPTFQGGKKVTFGPFQALPVDQGGDATLTQVVDVSAKTALSNARTIYITVGARNSHDQITPKPLGYIFSAPVGVQPQTPPPPPPGGGAPNSDKPGNGHHNGSGNKRH